MNSSSKRRECRFVTVSQEGVDTLRPFYDGDYVTLRMSEVRKSINYIRDHWHEYDNFMNSLKKLMRDAISKSEDQTLKEKMAALFSSRKDWKENPDDVGDDTYDAVRIYTSPEGYQQTFALVNSIFRNDGATQSIELIRAAVFLVELFNIDLYNYCLRNPRHGNFQGVVYRGMGISSEDLKRFQELPGRPVPQRYIAIPLGLMSSSLDYDVAKSSAQITLTESKQLLHPLIMKVHVIEMTPSFLQCYRQRFPTSVVSGICAVNIQELSYHADEQEVILRGPFFQILRLFEKGEINGKALHILEVVMLNSNRDHLSSVSLGDQEAKARDMFGTMVAATRYEFCAKFCSDNSLPDDGREYKALLEEKLAYLETLIAT